MPRWDEMCEGLMRGSSCVKEARRELGKAGQLSSHDASPTSGDSEKL